MTENNIKKSLHTVLENNQNHLGQLLEKAFYLEKINLLVKKLIEEPLSSHCKVANIRDRCLVLQVDSPTWATPLCYTLPEILKKIRATIELSGIERVIYQVEPGNAGDGGYAKKTPERKPHLSTDTTVLLNSAAAETTHPELKEIFKQLAERGRK